jgi:hypothetical protein
MVFAIVILYQGSLAIDVPATDVSFAAGAPQRDDMTTIVACIR